MYNVDLKIVFELLKEVREDQKKHGTELAKQSAYLENMDSDVKQLKGEVAQNTKDLAHHIKRTDILETLHRDNQKKIELSETRLENLEEPVKAKEWLKKHVVTIVSVVTAIASIVALILEHSK
jgi:hypothetical protein